MHKHPSEWDAGNGSGGEILLDFPLRQEIGRHAEKKEKPGNPQNEQIKKQAADRGPDAFADPPGAAAAASRP